MAEVQCRLCPKKCKTLQGWKMHMSGAHGGYDDAQLAEVAGGTPQDDVRSRMDRFSQTIEVDGQVTEEAPNAEARPSPPPPPPEPEAKRVKATPKKFKKILADIPAQILEAQGIKLDDDDEETLEEAAEFLSDIFGVEFQIPQTKHVIESRFLAILWVAGIIFLVWVKHRIPQVWEMLSSDKRKKGKKDEVSSNKSANPQGSGTTIPN